MKRFQLETKTLAAFMHDIHVRCPQCEQRADILTLPRLKPWDSEVLVRAQSISVLLKPSDEGVPSPLLRQTI